MEQFIYGVPCERVKELCTAEKEERCMVLPCKVGNTVFAIHKFGVTGAEIVGIQPMTGLKIIERPFTLYMLNMEFYLTRAEAEEALKGADHERN